MGDALGRDRQRDFEDAVVVRRGDLRLVDVFREPEPSVVGPLPTPVVVGVFGGDVQHAAVPREVDLLAVEAGEFDREDELVVLLVQFVVAAAVASSKMRDGNPSPCIQELAGSVGSAITDHLVPADRCARFIINFSWGLVVCQKLPFAVEHPTVSVSYIVIQFILGVGPKGGRDAGASTRWLRRETAATGGPSPRVEPRARTAALVS